MERVLWTAPKFRPGDTVRHEDWPQWRTAEVIENVEMDDGGRWVKTTAGEFGEGKLVKIVAERAS